jgi:hypothetical protein
VSHVIVAVESLTRSLSDGVVLESEVSEALGISLSKVCDLYFGGVDEVRRDHIVEEARDHRQEDHQF